MSAATQYSLAPQSLESPTEGKTTSLCTYNAMDTCSRRRGFFILCLSPQARNWAQFIVSATWRSTTACSADSSQQANHGNGKPNPRVSSFHGRGALVREGEIHQGFGRHLRTTFENDFMHDGTGSEKRASSWSTLHSWLATQRRVGGFRCRYRGVLLKNLKRCNGQRSSVTQSPALRGCVPAVSRHCWLINQKISPGEQPKCQGSAAQMSREYEHGCCPADRAFFFTQRRCGLAFWSSV